MIEKQGPVSSVLPSKARCCPEKNYPQVLFFLLWAALCRIFSNILSHIPDIPLGVG